jgi:hypothetical protein
MCGAERACLASDLLLLMLGARDPTAARPFFLIYILPKLFCFCQNIFWLFFLLDLGSDCLVSVEMVESCVSNGHFGIRILVFYDHRET